jgi:phosphoribosylformimino-5-aminoimidazole carboxamide ribotide isomerase
MRRKFGRLAVHLMFEHFTVIPAIDLKEGAVVRLYQGDMTRSTIYGGDPAVTASMLAELGAELIHIVDLDGAVAGAPRNLDAIRKIRQTTNCRIDVSGGLRTIESVRAMAAAGADFISIGSAAFLDPELLKRACEELPGRVFGSIDVRDGKLAIRGWIETTELNVAQAVERFEQAGVAALIVTDISRDGTERGLNTALLSEVASACSTKVIASGGVGDLDDLHKLKRHFSHGVVGVVIGRALYEQRFSLGQALSAARED